ncbi:MULTISPECIES: hypothetical protein [Paenibacillus]|uniref:Uncharacterized protein n=1 Tax=Paenibacillus borealis TaxID=160799 RepID=A0ABX3HMT0_PAEBO|nr:hypothetical protein [Paenibacillus borealis]OMD50810.1 hypothetical protein BSK56_06510 [Paenibacillus borealis]
MDSLTLTVYVVSLAVGLAAVKYGRKNKRRKLVVLGFIILSFEIVLPVLSFAAGFMDAVGVY